MSDDLTEDELEALSKAMGDGGFEDSLAKASPPEEMPSSAPSLQSGFGGMQGSQASAGVSSIAHAQFMQLEEVAAAVDLPPQELERMSDVKVSVEVVLGSTRKSLEEILRMQQGSVVTLERLAGEPVDITANGQLIARAEVVVIDDKFGVKILDIVGTHKKLSVLQG